MKEIIGPWRSVQFDHLNSKPLWAGHGPPCGRDEGVELLVVANRRRTMCCGRHVSFRTASKSSVTPVSRSETSQSVAIALSLPGRMTGSRTAGPLLTNRGP